MSPSRSYFLFWLRASADNKFSSFQRQLNLYGFRKVVKGRESGCYMHPSFLRDNPEKLTEVRNNTYMTIFCCNLLYFVVVCVGFCSVVRLCCFNHDFILRRQNRFWIVLMILCGFVLRVGTTTSVELPVRSSSFWHCLQHGFVSHLTPRCRRSGTGIECSLRGTINSTLRFAWPVRCHMVLEQSNRSKSCAVRSS